MADFTNVFDTIKEDEEQQRQRSLAEKSLFDHKQSKSDFLFQAMREDKAIHGSDNFNISGEFFGDPNEIMWQQQPWGDQLGNSLMQMLGKELVGGTISGFGAILDIPDMVMSLAQGEDLDFSNFITRFGDDIMDATQEAYPIYRKNPGAAWNTSDFGWWAENAVSVASTVGLLIPAMGTSKALTSTASWLTKLAKLNKAAGLTKNTEYFIKAVSMPISMRHAENYRESLDTKTRTNDEALQKLSGMSDSQLAEWVNSDEGTNFKVDILKLDEDATYKPGDGAIGELTAEKMADYISSYAGWKSYVNNAPNVFFDAIQLMPIIGLARGATRKGLIEKVFGVNSTKVLREELKLVGENIKKKGVIGTLGKNRLKNYTMFTLGQGTEGIEETVNAVAQEEGLAYGKQLLGQKTLLDSADYNQRLAMYLQDPHVWEQAFWGFAGGMAFGGVMATGRKIASASGYDRTESSQLKEVTSRKIKLADAGMKIQSIKDGVNVFSESYSKPGEQTKFEGTPEEIEEQKQEQIDYVISDLASNLGLEAARNGQVDALLNYINHKATKEQLASLLEGTNQDFNKIHSDLTRAIEDVEKSYKDLKVKFGKTDIDDGISDILISQVINHKGAVKKIENKISKFQQIIGDLMQDDRYTINPEIKTGDTKMSIDSAIELLAKLRLRKSLTALKDKEVNKTKLFLESDKDLNKFYTTKLNILNEELGLNTEEVDKFEANEKQIVQSIIASFGGDNIGVKLFTDYLDAKEGVLTNNLILDRHADNIARLQTTEGKEIEDKVKETVATYKAEDIAVHKETVKKIIDDIDLTGDIDAQIAKIKEDYKTIVNEDKNVTDKKHKKDITKAVNAYIDEQIDSLKQKSAIAKKAKLTESQRTSKLAEKLLNDIENTVEDQTTIADKLGIIRRVTADTMQGYIDATTDPDLKGRLQAMFDKLKNPPQEDSKYEENYAALAKFTSENPDATDNEKLLKVRELLGKNVHTYTKEQKENAITIEQGLATKIYNADPNNALAMSIMESYQRYADSQSQPVVVGEKETEETTPPKDPIQDFNTFRNEAAKEILGNYLLANNLKSTDKIKFADFIKYLYHEILVKRKDSKIIPDDADNAKFIDYADNFLKVIFNHARKTGIIGAKSTLARVKTETLVNEIVESYVSEEQVEQEEESDVIVDTEGSYSASFDQTSNNNTKRAEGDIRLSQSEIETYEAILSLKVGDRVEVRINTNHTKYNKDATDNENMPMGIYRNGKLISHVPPLDQVRRELEMVGRMLQQSNLDILSLLYPQVYALKENRTDAKVKALARGEGELGLYLLGIFNMYQDNLIEKLVDEKVATEHNEQFAKQLNKFLNLVVRQDRTYNTIDSFVEGELKASLVSWQEKLGSDFAHSAITRQQIGLDTGKSVTHEVKKTTPGNLVYAIDEDGNVMYRTLDKVFDDIEEIKIYDAAKGSDKQRLINQETNKADAPLVKLYKFKGAGSGYVLVKGIGVDEQGKQRYLPVPLQTTTFGEALNDEQKEYNKLVAAKVIEHINSFIDEASANAGKTTTRLEKIQEDIRNYIHLRKLNEKQQINFRYTDTIDGKRVQKIVVIKASKYANTPGTMAVYDAETGNAETFDGKTYIALDKPAFTTEITRIIGLTYRNLNYNQLKKFSKKNLAGKNYVDEVTGKPYESYKEFAIKTGLIKTSLGAVRSETGKIIGHVTTAKFNNGPKQGRSLNVRFAMIHQEVKPKTVMELYEHLLKSNPDATQYKELFETASKLGVTLDWSKSNDTLYDSLTKERAYLLTRYNTIIFGKDYFNPNVRDQQLGFIEHELIHTITNVSKQHMTKAQLKAFTNDLLGYNKELLAATADETLESLGEKGFSVEQARIIKSILGIIAAASKTDGYNLNHDEIITYALSNKTFARYLSTLEGKGEGKSKTFWGKLVDIIMYAITPFFEYTKLDELRDILDRHIKFEADAKVEPAPAPKVSQQEQYNPEPEIQPESTTEPTTVQDMLDGIDDSIGQAVIYGAGTRGRIFYQGEIVEFNKYKELRNQLLPRTTYPHPVLARQKYNEIKNQFGEGEVTWYPVGKRFRVDIAEPVMDERTRIVAEFDEKEWRSWQSPVSGKYSDDFLRKLDVGDPLSTISKRGQIDPELKQKYFADSDTTDAVTIATKISKSNHPLAPLASKLLPYIKLNNVKVELVENATYAGKYFYSDGKIHINNGVFRGVGSEPTILHELLHALTLEELATPSETSDAFTKLYEHAKASIGDDVYTTKDKYEFLVGLFTDAALIDKLKSISAIDGAKYTNLFEEIFDYILGLFGITEGEETLYSQAFAVATNIIDDVGRKREYKQYLAETIAIQEKGYNAVTVGDGRVDYELKAISILSSDKGRAIVAKGEKNNWSLDKILTELGIPKEQKRLFKESTGETIEDKIVDFASKYSFAVEMRVARAAKEMKRSVFYEDENQYEQETFVVPVNRALLQEDGRYEVILVDQNHEEFSPGLFTREQVIEEFGEELFREELFDPDPPSNVHQRLSVRDKFGNIKYEGDPNWEYNEVQINTPLIKPVIRGHAEPFKNDTGIGWIRIWKNRKTGEVELQEMQSDLFQKGRSRRALTINGEDADQFLQLLITNNNWVRFFINSIVQKYAREGYSVIRFPSGETAAIIEGHTPKAVSIKRLDNEIGLLDARLKNLRGEFSKIEDQEVPIFQGDNRSGTVIFTGDFNNPVEIAEFKNELLGFGYGIKQIEDYLREERLNRFRDAGVLNGYNGFLNEDDATYRLEILKQEKHELENKPLDQTKPIEAFYENRVTNTLYKIYGKENISISKDEYANEWKELTLKEEYGKPFQAVSLLDFSTAYPISPVPGMLIHEYHHAVNVLSGLLLENRDKYRALAEAEFKSKDQGVLKAHIFREVLAIYKDLGITHETHPNEFAFAKKAYKDIVDEKDKDGNIIKKNSKIWQHVRINMKAHGIFIAGDVDPDLNEHSKNFSDKNPFKDSGVSSVATQIKETILSTRRVDPTKVTNVGEDVMLEYDSYVKSPISGLPEYLGSIEVQDLLDKLIPASSEEDMMTRLRFAAHSVDLSYIRIYDLLRANPEMRKQWRSYFNQQKPDRYGNKVHYGSNVGVQSFLTNKGADPGYAKAETWYKSMMFTFNLKMDKATEDLHIAKLRDIIGRSGGRFTPNSILFHIENRNLDAAKTRIVEGFAELGVYINEHFIDNELSDTVRIDKAVARLGLENPTATEVKYNILLEDFNTILEKFVDFGEAYTKNVNTKFEQYGSILAFGKRYIKYQKNVEHSSTSMDKSHIYTISNSNFYSSFFKKLHSNTKEGREEAFEYAKKMAAVVGAQYESLLWNTDPNSPNGILDWKDGGIDPETGDIIKVPTAINESFAQRYTYLIYEGAESKITNRTYNYSKLNNDDFNYIALMDFLQLDEGDNTSFVKSTNNPNDVIYTTLIPSDKTTYYKSTGIKIPMIDGITVKDGEVTEINWESPIMKALYNVALQHNARIQRAANQIFEKDENGLFTQVRPGATTGELEIDGYKQRLQEYKHYDKVENGHIIFLRNPKGEGVSKLEQAATLTGKIFNLKQFDYTDANGKTVSLPLTQKQLLYEGVHLHEQVVKDHIEGFVKNRMAVANQLFDYKKLNDRLEIGDMDFRILEFMINDYLYNVSQQNIFFGNSFEYKNSVQTNKRAFQVFSPVRYAAAEQGETFLASTVNDIEVPSKFIKEHAESISLQYTKRAKLKKVSSDEILLIERAVLENNPELLNDDQRLLYTYNILKPYGKIVTTDGQSYITLDEFKRRAVMFGIADRYKEVFDKLDKGETLNLDDTKLLLQPQKNFYYNRVLEEISEGEFDTRAEQVKNSEFILVPHLLPKEGKLRKLYDAMVDHGIVQVNFKTAEKVGNTYTTDLHKSEFELADDYSEILARSAKPYEYAFLGIQQELPSDIIDHSNKFGKQIAKLVLNNIFKADAVYDYKGKPTKGQDLIDDFFASYNSNIKDGAIEAVESIGLDIKKSGVFDNIDAINDPKTDMTIDMRKIVDILKTYADVKGMTIHDLYALEFIEGTDLTRVPLPYSAISSKWQEVLTNMFTKKVINQKIPGPHAIQTSQALIELSGLSKGRRISQLEEELQVDLNRKLKAQHWTGPENNRTYHPNEILLPAWTKSILAKKFNVTIDQLDDIQANIMIGYRIPSEEKHSMSVMKVVGFLDEVHGATIVLPDDFINTTGSDFDIDTVYLMAYSTEVTDGQVKKIEYLDDSNSTAQERFDIKYRPKHYSIGKLIKSKLATDLGRLAKMPEEKKELLLAKLVTNTAIVDFVDDVERDEAIAMLLSQALLSEKIKHFDALLDKENERIKNLGITPASFAKRPMAEQNKAKANANRILDVIQSILSSEAHAIEALTPNYYADITKTKEILDEIAGINEDELNPLNFETQALFRNRAMAAVTLKGISVNVNNLVGLLQFLNVEIADQYAIRLRRKGDAYQPARGISKKKDMPIDENQSDIAETTPSPILTLNQIGKYTDTFYNDEDSPITTYLSQAVSNILDAIADPLPSNINEATLVPWMVIPAIGGTWAFSTYLMNTGLFRHYSDVKASSFDVNTDTTTNDLAEATERFEEDHTTVMEMAKKKVLGTTSLTKEQIAKRRELLEGDTTISEDDLLWYIRGEIETEDDLYKYEVIHKEIVELGGKVLNLAGALNAATFAFAVDRQSIGPNLFNVQKVDDGIERMYKYTSMSELPGEYKETPELKMMPHNIDKIVDGTKTATSREHKREDGEYKLPDNTLITIKGTKYDKVDDIPDKEAWAISEGFMSFEHMRDNARIPAVVDFMNGKGSMYVYDITDVNTKFRNAPTLYIKEGENKLNLVDAVYNKGYYSPISTYYKYGFKLAEASLKGLFINQLPSYNYYHSRLNTLSNEDNIHRAFDNYIMKNIMSSAPFFAELEDNKKARRVLGIDTEYRRDVNVESLEHEDLAQFKELSLANKIDVLKANPTYAAWMESLGESDLFKYFETRTSKRDIFTFKHEAVLFKNNNTEFLQDSFLTLFYNNNPYLRDVAYDLVRYNYLINGLSFGQSISKIIPAEVIAKPYYGQENINPGVGLSSHIYETLNSSPDITMDMFNNFIRSEPRLAPSLKTKYIKVNLGRNNFILNPRTRLQTTKGSISLSDDGGVFKLPVINNSTFRVRTYQDLLDLLSNESGKDGLIVKTDEIRGLNTISVGFVNSTSRNYSVFKVGKHSLSFAPGELKAVLNGWWYDKETGESFSKTKYENLPYKRQEKLIDYNTKPDDRIAMMKRLVGSPQQYLALNEEDEVTMVSLEKTSDVMYDVAPTLFEESILFSYEKVTFHHESYHFDAFVAFPINSLMRMELGEESVVPHYNAHPEPTAAKAGIIKSYSNVLAAEHGVQFGTQAVTVKDTGFNTENVTDEHRFKKQIDFMTEARVKIDRDSRHLDLAKVPASALDSIYSNLESGVSLLELKKAFIITNKYYSDQLEILNNVLSKYDRNKMAEITASPITKQEFNDDINFVDKFLRSLEYMAELTTLNNEESKEYHQLELDINDLVKELVSIKTKAGNTLGTLTDLRRTYFGEELSYYTTNPEILANLKSLFESVTDETMTQRHLDPIFDTHNPFIAALIKKYRINEAKTKFEIIAAQRAWKDLLAEHNITTPEQFEKFLEHKDGKKLPRLVQKYTEEFTNIAFDYKMSLAAEATKGTDSKGYLDLLDEYNKWKEEYLSNPYKDEVIRSRRKAHDILTNNGEPTPAHDKARAIVAKLQAERNKIAADRGYEDLAETDEELDTRNDLNKKKRAARSLYDEHGVPRKGEDLVVAKLVDKYYTAMQNHYELFYDDQKPRVDANGNDLYKKEEAKAMKKGGKFYDTWFKNNTLTVYSKEFWSKFMVNARTLRRSEGKDDDFLEEEGTRFINYIRAMHRDADGGIIGTDIRKIEDLEEVKREDSINKEEKFYVPKGFPKRINEIYTKVYYDVKNVGTANKTNSAIAKARAAATKDIYSLLASRLKANGSIDFQKLYIETLTRLHSATKDYDLSGNLYRKDGTYEGLDFYLDEFNKNSSYGIWFNDNHEFKLMEKAFDDALKALEAKLSTMKPGAERANYEKTWLDTFTRVEIDKDVLSAYYKALGEIKALKSVNADPVSRAVHVDHYLKRLRDSRNDITEEQITDEVREFVKIKGDPSSDYDSGVIGIDDSKADLLSRKATMVADFKAYLAKRGADPFAIMEHVPTPQYFIDLRNNVKVTDETIEILNTLEQRLADGTTTMEDFNNHIFDNYGESAWYKENHYISGLGFTAYEYYTKLEPKDKTKIKYAAANPLYFSDVRVTNEDYIHKEKTAAAKWIHENVDFVESEYYHQARAIAITNQYKLDDGTGLKPVPFTKWFDLNHYWDPYKNEMVPISIWTDIKAKNTAKYEEKNKPRQHWFTRDVMKKYTNENYEQDAYGNPLPRETTLSGEKSKFVNHNYDGVKDNPVYKELTRLIQEIASYHNKPNMLNVGYLPAVNTNSDNNVTSKFAKAIGYYKKAPKFSVEGDNETIRFLDFPMIRMLSKKSIIKYAKRKPNETFAEYEARVVEDLKEANVVLDDGSSINSIEELIAENKKRYTENKQSHIDNASYDVANVINNFISAGLTYKFKRQMESELLNAVSEIRNMEMKKSSSKLDVAYDRAKGKIKGKPYAEEKGANTNLEKHMVDWMKMIFYDDFEKDEGEWTKIARTLQNYTSAKGMWFNITGAFNNVAYGRTQMAMERAAGAYWERKEGARAEIEYTKHMFQLLHAPSDGKYTSELPAIVKYMDILALTDETDYDMLSKAKNDLFKKYMSTNSLFVLHHIGEHYMQNKALIAMLYSHRVLKDGSIVSFEDYFGHLAYSHAVEFARDSSLINEAELQSYVDKARNKYDKTEKYTVDDYITWFLQSKDKETLRAYRTYIKENRAAMRKEFDDMPNGMTAFKFENGRASVNEEVTSLEAVAKFKTRVIGVNHKIHGIYNKEDANAIQQKALGRLAMQFRKFVRPGWVKRYGHRVGKPSWNERREEWDRGAYVDTYRFLTRPVKTTIMQRAEDGEATSAVMFTRDLASNYWHYISNIKLFYDTLPEYEKANIRRTATEMLTFATVLAVLPIILQALRGDDDDDEMSLVGAFTSKSDFLTWMEYQQDRLWTEAAFYTPYGVINEGRKLFRTPFAALSSIEQIGSLTFNLLMWPVRSEEDRVYKAGLYHGESKLGVGIKKSIPVYNQLEFKFKHLGQYYKLY